MVTIDTARKELQELAQWRPLLGDAAATVLGVSSPRLTWTGSSGAGDGSQLPFHLDSVIDRTDEGASGIRTPQGLDEIMLRWALQVAHGKGDPQPRSGLAYLQQQGVLEWAQAHDDWDALTDTIRDAHQAIGRITGHGPAIIGKCPKCGGRIVADSTKDGIDLAAFCEKCDSYYGVDNDGERTSADIKPAAIARLREVRADNERMVTYRQAMEIWEGVLDKDLFFSWVHAERLEYADTDPRTYPLSQINYLADLTATRRSARHKAS
jgi:hypothetical protein